jgi:hypothetical protein
MLRLPPLFPRQQTSATPVACLKGAINALLNSKKLASFNHVISAAAHCFWYNETRGN